MPAFRRRLDLLGVRAPESDCYAHGYHAELEPKALGFHVTVFAHVGLASQAKSDLPAFEAVVANLAARECYMLAGETDFLLKVGRRRRGRLRKLSDQQAHRGTRRHAR